METAEHRQQHENGKFSKTTELRNEDTLFVVNMKESQINGKLTSRKVGRGALVREDAYQSPWMVQ